MVGYATTATFCASAQPAEADLYTTISNQVRHFKGITQPHIVVFEDLDVPPVAATFGEVMCTIYKTFGCAGLITSGGGRDLPQVHALEFPVFIGSSICSHGYCHLVDVNVPVRVGGLTVHPGDLLHGDCNGIALIPQEIAPELPSACERFSAIEAKLLSGIREGGPDPDTLQQARAEAAEATRDLSERIRFQS
jgi:regulator of RNase E activity RraA